MWKVSVQDEFHKNPELKQEDIDNIQTWMRTQPHLPTISDMEVILFLQACHWNVSQAKVTIESYYTYRTSLPDFFSARDPISKEIQDIARVVHVTILPQSDPQGNRIMWGTLVDPDPNRYNFASAVKYFTMSCEVFQLENGTVPGFIVVYDVKNLSLSHLIRTPLSQLSKYTHYAQEAASFPVKAVHYLNTNSILDKLLSITKPFLRSNILDVLHLHSNLESFFKVFPIAITPKDYGGNECTLKDMNEINLKNMDNYREFFIEEQNCRVDESKRVKTNKNKKEPDLTKENFKKLAID